MKSAGRLDSRQERTMIGDAGLADAVVERGRRRLTARVRHLMEAVA